MQPAHSSSGQTSGIKLLVAAVACAVIPLLAEIVSDGGLSGFGKPETGYTMIVLGFVLWPAALILSIIGFKRLLFDTSPELPAQAPPEPSREVHLSDAWAEINQTKNDNTPESEK